MKKYLIILGLLELITGLGGLAAGYSLIDDPSGAGLGMSLDLLNRSPLDNFLIPGLFLLIVNGFGQLLAAVSLFFWRRISGWLAVFFGFALVIWIIVQVAWIGLSSWMQPTFLLVGVAEVVLGWLIIRRQR